LPPGRLGAEQVPLAGMPPHHFPGGRNLKALGGAAVRLQLHFLVLLHNALFETFCAATAKIASWPSG
jgi:hypothetical protein